MQRVARSLGTETPVVLSGTFRYRTPWSGVDLDPGPWDVGPFRGAGLGIVMLGKGFGAFRAAGHRSREGRRVVGHVGKCTTFRHLHFSSIDKAFV